MDNNRSNTSLIARKRRHFAQQALNNHNGLSSNQRQNRHTNNLLEFLEINCSLKKRDAKLISKEPRRNMKMEFHQNRNANVQGELRSH
mmetsp:Transcript_9932/g.11158  ORF Transcript_9932/g.11158 Transcript_9932/m.11158 type:complete len:88 (+) Transcript_9932:1-264(+)